MAFTAWWLWYNGIILVYDKVFFAYQTPVPRLAATDPRFAPIATRAARLTCTTSEFDDLAKDVGLSPHPNPLPQGEGALMV